MTPAAHTAQRLSFGAVGSERRLRVDSREDRRMLVGVAVAGV